MREAGNCIGLGRTWVLAAVLAALLCLGACFPTAGVASPEAEYERVLSELKPRPRDVVSGSQLEQALRVEPGRVVQLFGVVEGLLARDEKGTILLGLLDKKTVDIEYTGDRSEAHWKARVRCLVKPVESLGRSRLDLLDITADSTPLELLQNAALAALKFPPKDPEEIARSAAELSRTAPMPTRHGDPSALIKGAIKHLNPRLSASEADTMAESIVKYSTKYGVDPYLVVAVIAAESRFNPNARSYKGAMGLGQLMPATAAAHGVDAYDPVANLEVAIRILRRNLDKYNEDWYKALAAYNAGSGAVDRYNGVPPYRETRNYLWAIYEYWCWLNGKTPEPRPR
ncbi:MAG: lytic transglycosylase domain-containing protein [Armatimonadota bacterium]|nr:lytic transglycosylase domain-containing protein [Armatimonadota bacterium]